MHHYFELKSNNAAAVDSDVEMRVILISNIRHLLQMINYSLLEWIASRNPEPDLQPTVEVLRDLLAPSDGTLVSSLEALLVCAEQNGWVGVFRPLITPVRAEDECLAICSEHPPNLSGLLKALVELRNDGGEGHGLPGGYRRKEEVAAYRFVLNALKDVTPKCSHGEIETGPFGREVRIRMLRVYSGAPVLIRKIRLINNSSVRVQGKYYNSQGALESTSYEAWNPFAKYGGQSLQSLREYDNSWGPMCYLPDRITDTFIGRVDERNAILLTRQSNICYDSA